MVPALADVVILDGIGHWTQQEAPAEVNDALVRMFAFESKEEALGDRVWSRYEDESDRKKLLELLRSRMSLDRHRLRLLRKDGTPVEVLLNVLKAIVPVYRERFGNPLG